MDAKGLFNIQKDGINYTLLRPSFPVNVFIDHFLVAKGYPLFLTERIFPNNQIELFFNLGAINKGTAHESGHTIDFSTDILSGLRTSYLEIKPGEYFYIAGMRFTLFGFYHLLGIPAHEIVNQDFAALDVLGKQMHELREKIGETDDVQETLRLMYQWVYTKGCAKIETARIWIKIDQFLQGKQTDLKYSLPQLLGYSHKHTVHLLRQMTGLSPKLIQRIYRFNSIFTHPESLLRHDWSETAYLCGYTHQSHFINEFKHFTGFTPSAFLEHSPKGYVLKQLR